MMEIRRGDIFYIKKRNDTVGHEQWSGRPGIVVSNDMLNRAEKTVEIVYLTTKPKKQSPAARSHSRLGPDKHGPL